MFSKKYIKGLAILASSAVFSMSTMHSAYAAPGALAKAPLFLSSIVEPNVFFTLDDSGSMDWNPMVKDGTAGIATFGGLPFIDGDDRAYYAPTFSRLYTSRGYLPPSGTDRSNLNFSGSPAYDADFFAIVADEIAEWDRSWVTRNHIGNRTYYDPSVTYVPWPGTKADGSPMYTNADPTDALKDPNDPTGESVDLTARYSYQSQWFNPPGPDNSFRIINDDYYIATYVIWDDDIKIPVDPAGEDPFDLVDTNLDGIIDSSDGVPTVANGIMEIDDGRRFVEIPASSSEMKNFANWFQYYRSRINATKLIIGTTINNTDASRMGKRWYNDTVSQVDVASMSDDGNKRNLLEKLYNLVIPGRGTPARQALETTGDYFRETGGGAPILPATQGGECQQNFNIIMSDGFWNGNDPSVGNTDRDSSGITDNGFDGDVNESVDDGYYEDGFSDTLADVAMDNYERDMRTDLANRVPTQEDVDEADHQHLVTYTIAFGLSGTLDLSLNPETFGEGNPDSFPGWPEPVRDQETTVDDMWHAAYNGRGDFLSASSTAELEASLGAAIADIAERTATAAAVSINSAKLTTQSVVYLAQFNTNRWQGDIQAFKIADLNTGVLSATPEWQAQTELNNRFSGGYPGASPRVILTHDGTDGVPFTWDKLSIDQQNDLKTGISPPAGFTVEDVAKGRLDYLRGDQSNEGGAGFGFRERLSLLADIVHAGPVFVGAPDLNWPDKAPFPTDPGKRYSDFKNGPDASRPGVVYTGSNGGMLHGFAEADGAEVMAYIPGNLFSDGAAEGLHYLTEPDYKHRYYVDLTPTLSDVYADLNNGRGTAWQTILIGGQRGGGRGIFALDVNDPAAFSETNAANLVLWEFEDANLGYTYSRPVIGMANNGRWVAVFGNGYNADGDGKARLYILDIAGGADGSWDAGDVIVINTESGDMADPNGLASPALADIDGDGDIDRVYAGDLRGQMWAFDLSSSITSSWDIPGDVPLYTTIDNQPITAKPTLAKHPTISDDGSNSPNLMVFFGSGQYLVDADKTTTDVNYFYGVWDRGDGNVNQLERQYFENGFTTWIDANGDAIQQAEELIPQRVLTRNVVDYAGGDYGWYFELPDSGERLVETPVVRGGVVFFNTFAPNTDACSVGGYGFRMAVDIVNGGSPLNPTTDVNGDGVIDDKDNASNGITTATVAGIRQDGYLPEPVFIEDIAYTAETPTKVEKLKKIPTGRFSWQELVQ